MAQRAMEREGGLMRGAGIVPGARIVDMGCGPGAMLVELASGWLGAAWRSCALALRR